MGDTNLPPQAVGTVNAGGTPLVVNGLGADVADPMSVYAMSSMQGGITPLLPPTFYRISLTTASATALGVVGAPPLPVAPPGSTPYSFVINQAADGGPTSNYYLTGATLIQTGNTINSVRLYLGEISLAPVPTPTTPVWKEVDVSDPGAAAVIANLTTQANIFLLNPFGNPPPDGGFQDIIYVPATGNLVTYLGQEFKFVTISNITGPTPVVTTVDIPVANRLPLAGSTRQVGSMWRSMINGQDQFFALQSSTGVAYRFDPTTGFYDPGPNDPLSSGIGCSLGDASTAPPAITLPVTLVAFGAAAAAGGVQLTWKTASEKKAERFVVERSPDGRTWADRLALPATNRAGGAAYSAFDKDSKKNKWYYRLRMEDRDGSRTWSEVRVVTGAAAGPVTLLPAWPNPAGAAGTGLTIALSAALPGEVWLVNRLGQQVWRAPLTDGRAEADVSALAPGIYELIARFGTSQTAHQRVVVRHE